MTMRSTVKSVSFKHAFRLVGIDDEQPAGDYDVTTDEERIEGVNIQGWRRSATTILVSRRGITRSYTIDPVDLEASLMRDAGATIAAAGRT
jgi:hypothetical protein